MPLWPFGSFSAPRGRGAFGIISHRGQSAAELVHYLQLRRASTTLLPLPLRASGSPPLRRAHRSPPTQQNKHNLVAPPPACVCAARPRTCSPNGTACAVPRRHAGAGGRPQEAARGRPQSAASARPAAPAPSLTGPTAPGRAPRRRRKVDAALSAPAGGSCCCCVRAAMAPLRCSQRLLTPSAMPSTRSRRVSRSWTSCTRGLEGGGVRLQGPSGDRAGSVHNQPAWMYSCERLTGRSPCLILRLRPAGLATVLHRGRAMWWRCTGQAGPR